MMVARYNSDRYSEYHLAVPWPDAVVTSLNSRWAPIARYKCPHTFGFVAASPTTSTGKVSKRDLRVPGGR